MDPQSRLAGKHRAYSKLETNIEHSNMVSIREWFWQWLGSGQSQEISYESACERAARGAAYLDEVDPGWYSRLDSDALQLANGKACVLGQLHGDFRMGLGRSALFNMSSAPRASLSPVHLGFLCVQGASAIQTEEDYTYLNRAWLNEVRQRAAATSVRPRVTRKRRAPSREVVPH